MAENLFNNIRIKAGDTEKSFNWYKQQVNSLRSLSSTQLMRNTPDLTTNILPGMMYMFLYDPKHKETLPVYDKFPLVLPFRKVSDGFYGINLHYLPYLLRFKLLGALQEYTTTEKISEITRLKLSWNLLQSMSKVAPVKNTVKHYLYNQLETKFLNIKYPDWTTAAMLPVEKFVGKTKQDVWKQTNKR